MARRKARHFVFRQPIRRGAADFALIPLARQHSPNSLDKIDSSSQGQSSGGIETPCAKTAKHSVLSTRTIRRRPSDKQSAWSCVGADLSCVRPATSKLRTIGLCAHFGLSLS